MLFLKQVLDQFILNKKINGMISYFDQYFKLKRLNVTIQFQCLVDPCQGAAYKNYPHASKMEKNFIYFYFSVQIIVVNVIKIFMLNVKSRL
jgi:hypothetical protein